MAAAIKALNARIRANPTLDYFCSTHFWGPASNFGIPLAAVADTQKDPEIISGRMTASLMGYSGVFMRYAFAVTPKNYLLFGCHAVNFSAQSVQAYRFTNWWYMGGRENHITANPQGEIAKAEMKAEGVKNEAKGVAEEAKEKVGEGVEKAKELVR